MGQVLGRRRDSVQDPGRRRDSVQDPGRRTDSVDSVDVEDPADDDTTPMLPGVEGAPAASTDNVLVESKLAWIMTNCLEGCTKIKYDCERSWQALQDCCSWCGRLSCTCLGCCGCCQCLKDFCRPCCPLSKRWALPKKAFADNLESKTTLAAMGILSLNIYCATYFVGWHPDGSRCVAGTADTTFPNGFKIWANILAVFLPFAFFPVTMYVAGQAKALQKNLRGIGCVAGAVIAEVTYILSMGALMTVCQSAISWVQVSIVTGIIVLLLLITWGCCCYSPKWLRGGVSLLCCWGHTCAEVDVEAAQVVPDAATAPESLSVVQTAAATNLHTPAPVQATAAAGVLVPSLVQAAAASRDPAPSLYQAATAAVLQAQCDGAAFHREKAA